MTIYAEMLFPIDIHIVSASYIFPWAEFNRLPVKCWFMGFALVFQIDLNRLILGIVDLLPLSVMSAHYTTNLNA